MKLRWRTAERFTRFCGIIGLATLGAELSHAQTTVTDTFIAQIKIEAECKIQSTSVLDFGTQGVLDVDVDQTADLTIQCTDTTPYAIELDAGMTTGGTTTTRLMERVGGTETIQYRMFQDSGRTTNWGETAGTEDKTATGDGDVQTHTIYGRVPVQTTPQPGDYDDTVTVSVIY